MNKLLSITQAADLLGVNAVTLRRWDKKGILSSIRINKTGHRRYSQAELEEWIQKIKK